MTRLLYQWMLWLHPPRFRREFAGEMLWIFESSVESDGAAGLLLDGLRSLGRQWLLRSGSWKIAVALAGAALQVTLGGFGMMLFHHHETSTFLATAPYRGDWVGTLREDSRVTPIELAMGKNPSAWFGAMIVSPADGEARSEAVMDFQATGDAVEFRVGEMRFRGRLAGGRMSGTVDRQGGAAGAWELERPLTSHAAAAEPGIHDLLEITVLLVPGVMLAVVLLALWTRGFTLKRSPRFKPVIR